MRRGAFSILKAGETAVYLGAMLVFSWFWLELAVNWDCIRAGVSPELTDWYQKGVGESGDAFVLATAILTYLAPFVEETIFRGFALPEIAALFGWRRAKRPAIAYVVAIVLTSALWSVGHGGVIDPEWVKWIQIFGIGCVLGVARFRLGLEACIVLHMLFNLVGGYFMPGELGIPLD